jgi:hypothetical protein
MIAGEALETWFSHGFFGLVLVGLGGFGLRHAKKLHAAAAVLERMPFVPVSQATSGPVRIRGTITQSKLVASPFTGTACCCYRVEVEESDATGADGVHGGDWSPLYTEISSPAFQLRDATGSMEVRPQGMDIDAPASFTHAVISKPKDAREERLIEFVRQHCPNRMNVFLFDTVKTTLLSAEARMDPRIQDKLRQLEERRHAQLHKKTKGQTFLFRETCLLPGQEFEIAGTVCQDNSGRVLAKGSNGLPFLLSNNSGEALNKAQRRKARTFTVISLAVLILGLLVILRRQI